MHIASIQYNLQSVKQAAYSHKRVPIRHSICLNNKSESTISDKPGFMLVKTSVTAHKLCHFLDSFNRERRCGKRFHGNRHEFHGIVIRGNTIGAKESARAAPMHNCPLSVLSDPYGNRLHMSSAVCCPISGLYVHMKTVQAVGTMVPVVTPRALRHYHASADFACK